MRTPTALVATLFLAGCAAGTHQPNNGINSSLPMVGFSMRLD